MCVQCFQCQVLNAHQKSCAGSDWNISCVNVELWQVRLHYSPHQGYRSPHRGENIQTWVLHPPYLERSELGDVLSPHAPGITTRSLLWVWEIIHWHGTWRKVVWTYVLDKYQMSSKAQILYKNCCWRVDILIQKLLLKRTNWLGILHLERSPILQPAVSLSTRHPGESGIRCSE